MDSRDVVVLPRCRSMCSTLTSKGTRAKNIFVIANWNAAA